MNKRKSSGQAIVAAMALILVGGVILFMVFNSGRSVNEKINLVNAADAAAYSGAQIAARDLNYIAYTNRAMIANEIVVGHMVSYQAEVSLLMQVLADPQGPLGLVLNWLSALGIPLGNGITQAATTVREITETLSGIYVLHAGANTALYSGLQQEIVEALSADVDGQHPIMSVMQAVASRYDETATDDNDTTAPVQVNDETYLNEILTQDLPGLDDSDVHQHQYLLGLRQKADQALNFASNLCQSIIFASPDIGGGNGNGNVLATAFAKVVTVTLVVVLITLWVMVAILPAW